LYKLPYERQLSPQKVGLKEARAVSHASQADSQQMLAPYFDMQKDLRLRALSFGQ
jgi:hypothetical protein